MMNSANNVRGLVAVVGARNLVSERLKTALGDRFAFEFLDTPSTVASMPNATPPRPSLYVVNCYRTFGAGVTVRKDEDKRRRGSIDAFDKWTLWIAELQRQDPNVPIVVALNEQHDSAMVGRAVAAGADEVIGAAVADVPQLVRQRVWSLLLETDRELAESLWDDIAVAPMTASSPTAGAVPQPAVPGGWARNRRRSIGRRHDDSARAAGTVAESCEAPVNSRDAEAAMQRVPEALPSLPTAEQRAAPLADLMQVRAPSLRASSGRLDAGRIAARLGVSVSRLAGPLQVSRQALSEMPDSPKAQKGLDPFARALAVLEELLPNEKTVRAWLVSPQQ